MDVPSDLRHLCDELRAELVDFILPFWVERAVDDVNGGFVGRVDAKGRGDYSAPKGGILNARILWTFSAAYRILGDEAYRVAAERSFDYLDEHFIDDIHGGVIWMVRPDGRPADERKHVYTQAFAIYAYSEYFRATGDARALERAVELYRLVEVVAADHRDGGYFEAFTREWLMLEDVRLSDKDADERKSTNTHLHLLEAYTNLLRVWPDRGLYDAVLDLLGLFVERIYDPARRVCIPFFDDDWTPRSRAVSFGHDIETSWLLMEAVRLMGTRAVVERVKEMSIDLASSVLERGLASGGGLLYTIDSEGEIDTDRHWWPQAEAVVGFVEAWESTGDTAFLDAAVSVWDFTNRYIADRVVGEWHERVRDDGTPYPGEDRIHEWKCPYHSSRASLELIERIGRLEADAEDPVISKPSTS